MANERVGDCNLGTTDVYGLSSILDQKFAKLATKEDFSKLSGRVQVLEEENRYLREEIVYLGNQNK